MLRTIIAALSLSLSLYAPLYARGAAVVLQYHHVDVGTPAITSITPTDFAAQLEYLDDANFSILPLSQITDALKSGLALPSATIAITFDDAYSSIYTEAYPLLKKKKFPFTIFVATNLVGSSSHYLNWQQLAEMADNGALIANHTRSHLHLLRKKADESNEEWRQRIGEEISGAQIEIDKHLGESPRLFAYPYGEYNQDVLALVASLGYEGFGQQSGAAGADSDFLALPRFPLAGNYAGLAAFKTKVNTLPMPIRGASIESLLEPGNLRPELVLNFTEGKWRTGELTCYGPGGKMDIAALDSTTFRVLPVMDVPIGRSRYNCTMPANEPRRYFWYSQPWIRKKDDGSWYAEP
ncbi:MAG: polysaccharide deacetylase [Gammaproteobacteria bacterium]|nr:polysaccharide deacetylase [Gammaproteobacteria bacterium]